MRKIIFSLVVLSVLAQSAFAAESAYDKEMRREFPMPAEWFTCQASSDCALVAIPCMASLSVSAKDKGPARDFINKQLGVSNACTSTMPDFSTAVCDNGQCVTVRVPKVIALPCAHGFKSWVKPPKSPNDEIACDEENLQVFKTYLGRCNISEAEGQKYDFDNDKCVTCSDYSQWKDNIKELYAQHKRSTDGQTLTFGPCDKS